MNNKYTPELIHSLAQSISAGFVCYLNPDSLEVVEIPKDLSDMTEFDEDDLFQADLDRVENEWEKCITIDPPEPFESFKYMERFAASEELTEPLRNALANALANRKPFKNFRNIVDASEFRQQWFDFQQSCLEEYVRRNIELEQDE